MEKNILVYNNRTGIAEKMAPLMIGEGFSVLVAADLDHLYTILEKSQIHLMLVDVELNDKGWDKGIEMIAGLRAKSSIPLIVVSAQSAETAKIMALEAGRVQSLRAPGKDQISAAQIYPACKYVCQY